MASQHTVADDIVYDIVSVQYHALKAAQTYDKYIEDAEGHEDVKQFLEEAKQQDEQRARRAHELLKGLTDGGIG